MQAGQTNTVITLGLAQMLAWGSSYYLPAFVAGPMAGELGVPVSTVFAAFSVALILSAFLGPHSGRAIDRFGGRPVLMITNIIFAVSLVLLGSAQSRTGMFLGWALLGVAMGSGLYEAAFSTLVRLYGDASRSAITGVTLIAGFASTVGWPVTAWLQADFSWRHACFVWGMLHLMVGLPLNARLPRFSAVRFDRAESQVGTHSGTSLGVMLILSFVFAATWFLSTAMASHLPRLLQAWGVSFAAAIAVGALIGPAQVCARLLEFGLGRKAHPIFSARIAAVLHPLGATALIVFGAPAATVFGILHGAGNGILTIAMGKLPLVYFGPNGYGRRQGLLMIPARIAQAVSPWLFGLALDRWGAGALGVSTTVASLGLIALLLLSTSGPARRATTACEDRPR